MAAINPQKITGKWLSGVALDFHTTSSTAVGVNEYGRTVFDTVRPELGELLYRLKYKGDQSVAPEIIAVAAGFLTPHLAKIDLMVPVPPSAARTVQPVILLANGIGAALGIPVIPCVTTTRETAPLKEVDDPEKRKELVTGLYAVDPAHTAGKNILLFDDLFRSGVTLNAITDVLTREGCATAVRVLTITRTRSNQ